MTPSAPIKLTLYEPENGEIREEFSTCIIPWGILKRAMRFAKRFGSRESIDVSDMTEDDVDEMSGLVVDLFNGKFTAADLEHYTDLGEVAAVMQAMLTRAGSVITNFQNPKR